jgi:hypothetical protein
MAFGEGEPITGAMILPTRQLVVMAEPGKTPRGRIANAGETRRGARSQPSAPYAYRTWHAGEVVRRFALNCGLFGDAQAIQLFGVVGRKKGIRPTALSAALAGRGEKTGSHRRRFLFWVIS